MVKIQSIITDIESKINSSLSIYPGKKIIFTGQTNDLQSIVIATPESSLNTNNRGLVDFTQIQKNILDRFDIALLILRLTNGQVFYVDYKRLVPFLVNENMSFNDRALEHWKLHISPREEIITIKGKDNMLPMETNPTRILGSHSESFITNENTKKFENFNTSAIKTILRVVNQFKSKQIFYIGMAQQDIVINLKQITSIVLADWYDKTKKSINFWYESEEEEGFVCPEIPEWAKDVPVQIEGIPPHDLLLLDIVISDNDYLKYCDCAKIVILFGSADLENFYHKDLYDWYKGDVVLGISNSQPSES